MSEQQAPEQRFCLVTKEGRRSLWFKQMTAIGPMSTPIRDERATFSSRAEAMRCPAYTHLLSTFEVATFEVADA